MTDRWSWRTDYPVAMVLVLAVLVAVVVFVLVGLAVVAANGPRLPTDPRRTLEAGGFMGVEFQGPALADCPAEAAEAHRFTATRGGNRVSGAVCCWPGELGDPCRVRFGLGTRGAE